VKEAIASVDQTKVGGGVVEPSSERHDATRRVLVVYEEGRAGAMALREAAELAAGGAELVVATLAPQAKPLKCCKGGGAGPYNCAVRNAAAGELLQARSLLGSLAARASFTILAGTPERPLDGCSPRQSFDTILVPGRRLARGGGQLAREARRWARGQVRVVVG